MLIISMFYKKYVYRVPNQRAAVVSADIIADLNRRLLLESKNYHKLNDLVRFYYHFISFSFHFNSGS